MNPTTGTFSLAALIREVVRTSTFADPVMLAKEVDRRIKKSDRDEALAQALPGLVRETLSLSRRATSFASAPPSEEATTAPVVQIPEQRRPNRSWKRQGISEYWRRVLVDHRLSVGSDVAAWKVLGDCTSENLFYAADTRDEHARRNAEKASQYRRLAELLIEHGAATVKDLPESVLAVTLVRAA